MTLARTLVLALPLLTGAVVAAGCAEQDALRPPGATDPAARATSTTLRIDRPDDTADPTAPVDVTSPGDDLAVEQPRLNATAVVRVDGERYELDVEATDCSFDLAGAWDVNGTTVLDGVTVGFSTSYQYTPAIDEGSDRWSLLVYLSFDLGDQGAYQHFYDTEFGAGSDRDPERPRSGRPTIDASSGRLQMRVEFVDPTGILLDAGDTTPGRVDVSCS